jgi:hypothetical protein
MIDPAMRDAVVADFLALGPSRTAKKHNITIARVRYLTQTVGVVGDRSRPRSEFGARVRELAARPQGVHRDEALELVGPGRNERSNVYSWFCNGVARGIVFPRVKDGRIVYFLSPAAADEYSLLGPGSTEYEAAKIAAGLRKSAKPEIQRFVKSAAPDKAKKRPSAIPGVLLKSRVGISVAREIIVPEGIATIRAEPPKHRFDPTDTAQPIFAALRIGEYLEDASNF